MEPRMLDKINDLKRIEEERRQAEAAYNKTKMAILSECRDILVKAGLSRDDIYSFMTPF